MALSWKKHDLPTRAQKEAKAKEQAEKDRRVEEEGLRIVNSCCWGR